ncbi:hypothetical protein CDL15_Pgr018042 [Punica granatum]|uniref:RING-type E3 ubiquitin transferase n=1 Tax=Punica granatum TaxID=22663 RepID=A0A218WI59_PUNGR|nr:hypothetical protein CDL15_Pgr018042 [Punica granatum]
MACSPLVVLFLFLVSHFRDGAGCLARIQGFSFDGSVFTSSCYRNFAFLNCSTWEKSKSIAACNESNIAAVSSSLTPPASDQQHQQVVTMMGMDRATIESYPKTLVEDQLAPPSDEMCPICMSEYRSKETLRTIPKCNH